MAYFYEKTIKDQLMLDIEELMNATDTHIVSDSMEDMAYEDLIECKNTLIKEYVSQQNITEFQFNYPKE